MKKIQQQLEGVLLECISQNEISIIVPSLYCSEERCTIFKTLLLMRESVTDVTIKTEKNLVIIKFDSENLTQNNLINLLQFVLKNFAQKPSEVISEHSKLFTEQQGEEVEFDFEVEGMTCESCALFLNMVLSREQGIKQINIDYETKYGVVRGYLNQEKVFNIISEQGFQAHGVGLLLA